MTLLLTLEHRIQWYTLQTCMLSVSYNLVCIANIISYHFNFARLLCAGEREVVQSMSEVALIDRDPVLSRPVHYE